MSPDRRRQRRLGISAAMVAAAGLWWRGGSGQRGPRRVFVQRADAFTQGISRDGRREQRGSRGAAVH